MSDFLSNIMGMNAMILSVFIYYISVSPVRECGSPRTAFFPNFRNFLQHFSDAHFSDWYVVLYAVGILFRKISCPKHDINWFLLTSSTVT